MTRALAAQRYSMMPGAITRGAARGRSAVLRNTALLAAAQGHCGGDKPEDAQGQGAEPLDVAHALGRAELPDGAHGRRGAALPEDAGRLAPRTFQHGWSSGA